MLGRITSGWCPRWMTQSLWATEKQRTALQSETFPAKPPGPFVEVNEGRANFSERFRSRISSLYVKGGVLTGTVSAHCYAFVIYFLPKQRSQALERVKTTQHHGGD